MKKHLIIALGAITILGTSSFTLLTNCGDFELFQQGVTYTQTSYNDKGKVESVVDATVKKVTTTTESTSADIDAVFKDGKGKDGGSASYTISCKDGSFSLDMKSFVTPQQKEAYKDMDIKIEGDMLNYPSDMKAGSTLPNGTMHMVVTNNGAEVNNMTIQIKDRKCLAIENKTTSAGTWECYKISYTVETTMKVGAMTMPIKPRQVTEWFSFKVGAVRSENMKNDKLESYTELTAFKKPQ